MEEMENEGNGPASSDPTPAAESAPQEPAIELEPLEAAQAELAKIRDQLLRTAADFDNFRKRTRRELTDAEKKGREELLREVLPVFDNLERAAAHAETATDVQALTDGIRMVMRQFHDTLSRIGIERIEAQGAPFDPALMEAIQQLETDLSAPGTVAAQVQAGYRMGERLIRPAMVVVAKAPAGPPAEASPSGSDGASET
jgi:molecular chaperone GrpE